MKKVVKKTTEKYVTEKTFETNMASIAKSFERVDAALEMVVQELKNLHEDNKYIRQTLSNFTGDVSRHDRKISDLDIRLEKLELKAK